MPTIVRQQPPKKETQFPAGSVLTSAVPVTSLNGSTEYDAYLENSSEAGLRRVETLFGELQ